MRNCASTGNDVLRIDLLQRTSTKSVCTHGFFEASPKNMNFGGTFAPSLHGLLTQQTKKKKSTVPNQSISNSWESQSNYTALQRKDLPFCRSMNSLRSYRHNLFFAILILFLGIIEMSNRNLQLKIMEVIYHHPASREAYLCTSNSTSSHGLWCCGRWENR
jgi:hypothetical protein